MKKKSGSKASPQLGSHHPPSFTTPVRQPGNLPNYMKSTTSADARRERSKVSTKRRSPPNSPHHSTNPTNVCLTSRQERTLVRKGSLEVARATCSSTLKGREFPGGVGLQGSSHVKVCPYSYCSYNGHHVPPLKCFVSARRRALKVKRNVKLPKTRPIGGTKEPATSNSDEISGDEVSQKFSDEEGLSTDLLFTSDNWDSVGLHNQAESFNRASTKDLTNEPYPGDSSEPDSIEGECNVVHELNSRNKTEDKSSKRATFKREKSKQEPDDPRLLNPPEPGAEKVNLRHQEVDARKNAEEWMVDYALRQAVTKGGTASQRKVALLVEAFERVVPASKH